MNANSAECSLKLLYKKKSIVNFDKQESIMSYSIFYYFFF